MMDIARLAMLQSQPEEDDLQSLMRFAGKLGQGVENAAKTITRAPLRADVPGECLPFALPRLPDHASGEAAAQAPATVEALHGSVAEQGVTVEAWSRRLAAGETTSVAITQFYLAKIAQKDPQVHAFLDVFREEALAQAAESDMRRKQGKPLSPLDGIPIAVKDNIAVQGHRCTCGSRMLETYVSPYDATAVARIRAAGMPILGKLNMDEFGMGGSTEHSAFGPTRNPHDLTRVPGGSSGGCAAAVAAGMAPIALGSDTGGSLRQPAAFCGVVGVKPAYGAVSRYGLVAFASSLDHIGPIAQTARDAAMLLRIVGGADPRDMTTDPALDQRYRLEEMEQPVLGDPFGLYQGTKKIDIPLLPNAVNAYYVLSSAEASSNLARYDGVRYGHRAAAYADLDDLYRQSRDEGLGDEVQRRILLGTFALSSGYQDAYYLKAQAVRDALCQQVEAALQVCDAIIMPVAPTQAYPLGEKRTPIEMYLGDCYTVLANLTGLPAVSVPTGQNAEGLPTAVGLLGRRNELGKLLKLAEEVQKHVRL